MMTFLHRHVPPRFREHLSRRAGSHDVLAPVPLASLHGNLPGVAEDIPHSGTQSLGAIGHDEQRLIGGEPTVPELAEETRDGALVPGRGLYEAEDSLLPRRRYAHRDDQLIAGERLATEHQHQPLGIVEAALLEPAQLAGTARMKRRDTLDFVSPNASGTASAAVVLAAREPAQHLAEQPRVLRARRLQLRVGRQRHFTPSSRSRTRGRSAR